MARRAFRPTRLNVATWFLWAVTLGFELAVTFLIRSGHVYGWERDLTRWLQDLPLGEPMFELSNFLTNTLSVPFLLFFSVVITVVFLLQHRIAGALLWLTFPAHVLGQFPKALVDRDRPSGFYDGIDGVGGSMSFPSGHAEYAITFYGLLLYIALRHVPNRWPRAFAVLAWLGLVLASGFGRIATGRHWPLDIFVGYAVGVGLLVGFLWLYRAALAGRRETEGWAVPLTIPRASDWSTGRL
jgi:membrane-associated phospholipid phosphatase